MELNQKYAQTYVEGLKELTVTIEWSSEADFDLAAAYEAKDDTRRIVYYGERRSLDQFPYIHLSKDLGVDDQPGDNREILTITNLGSMKYVHILCWDYGRILEGRTARFRQSDIKLTATDSKGNTFDIALDTGDRGNVAVLATIDNTNRMGAKLVNVSRAGTLKGLKHSDQLFGVIDS